MVIPNVNGYHKRQSLDLGYPISKLCLIWISCIYLLLVQDKYLFWGYLSTSQDILGISYHISGLPWLYLGYPFLSQVVRPSDWIHSLPHWAAVAVGALSLLLVLMAWPLLASSCIAGIRHMVCVEFPLRNKSVKGTSPSTFETGPSKRMCVGEGVYNFTMQRVSISIRPEQGRSSTSNVL